MRIICRPTFHRVALLHTTARNHDLMEFFDDEKNWNKNKIQHGRSWKADELRNKSNEDLHKLWYVLLKERNMLMTMEHACNEAYELFPSPERIDKVQESMKNIETVVRERNEAYYQLETGETGERPTKYVWNILGMKQFYRLKQHLIPKHLNTKWKQRHLFGYGGHAVRKFQKLYREKLWNEKRRAQNREKNAVISLLKKFPNVDIDTLKEKYPSVDMDKIFRSRKVKFLRVASRYE
ncbi:39S ribosomal protein L47, mitochondrial isoform X2 [Nasonia vitripennis]|uniref:Large ribosomal subunit protein uL29m n=1 Tax=Nasonia vitripennis TaxID=7425 RepID=A0A7M7IWW3_NASVI|nr:39S ribosomal protein L47, mitochondrial isoform X2 [Nasonia vitripennis]